MNYLRRSFSWRAFLAPTLLRFAQCLYLIGLRWSVSGAIHETQTVIHFPSDDLPIGRLSLRDEVGRA